MLSGDGEGGVRLVSRETGALVGGGGWFEGEGEENIQNKRGERC